MKEAYRRQTNQPNKNTNQQNHSNYSHSRAYTAPLIRIHFKYKQNAISFGSIHDDNMQQAMKYNEKNVHSP